MKEGSKTLKRGETRIETATTPEEIKRMFSQFARRKKDNG